MGSSMVSKVETNPEFQDWDVLAALLRKAYAPMAGRIDQPSSLTTMTRDDIAAKARVEDLFLIRDADLPIACGFGAPQGDAYEIGKVAVADTHRRRGLARALIEAAAAHARAQGFGTLQLYARIELTENRATYEALGFHIAADFTHPGFTRPTAHFFQRAL